MPEKTNSSADKYLNGDNLLKVDYYIDDINRKDKNITSIINTLQEMESTPNYSKKCFLRGFLWTALAVSLIAVLVVFPQIKDSLWNAAKTTFKASIEWYFSFRPTFSDPETIIQIFGWAVINIGTLAVLSPFLITVAPLLGTLNERYKCSKQYKDDLIQELISEQKDFEDIRNLREGHVPQITPEKHSQLDKTGAKIFPILEKIRDGLIQFNSSNKFTGANTSSQIDNFLMLGEST